MRIALLAAAVACAASLFAARPDAGVPPAVRPDAGHVESEDEQIAKNFELLENMDLIQRLDQVDVGD